MADKGTVTRAELDELKTFLQKEDEITRTDVQDLKAQGGSKQEDVEDLKKEVADLTKEVERLGKALDEMRYSPDATRQRVDLEQLKNSVLILETWQRSSMGVMAITGGLQGSVSELDKAMKAMSKIVPEHDRSIQALEKTVEKLGKQVGKGK